MKFFKKHKNIILSLLVICIVSVICNLYDKHAAPVGFNADEAAFSYNAYSLLKTGRDEYGTLLPFRLKSFGDYKMPLFTYLSIPFIALFGLNEFSARFLNTVLAFLFPIAMFFFTQELFNKKKIALLAALLVSVSLGLHIVGRHAHEAYLTAFIITLGGIFFFKMLKTGAKKHIIIFLVTLGLSLISYQSSRIFALYFLLFAAVYLFFKKKNRYILLLIIGVIAIFSIPDVLYTPERVKNLLFFNDPGFGMQIHELRIEGGIAPLYNKVTVGIRDVLQRHIAYFSPEFLAINGDSNPRFGFPKMSPMTIIEYLFFFVGLYYLFKNKEKWRYFIVTLLVITPLSASLSWAGTSLTRSLFLFVPVLVISSYGLYYFLKSVSIKPQFLILLIGISLLELLLLFFSWDFYLHHYPKRELIARSWQYGYPELMQYIKDKYAEADTFYISKEYGQPYIFALFYLQYDPAKYQKQAVLSGVDEYGFGQVEKFDKFVFRVEWPKDGKKDVIIGYPHDFRDKNIDYSKIKKINFKQEEIFWIYEM